MADKNYAGAAGFIQFDPREREVNGQTVQDVTIRAFGSNKLVGITVWPEFDLELPLEKGDFIGVDGSFTTSLGQAKDGSPREYINVSPSMLFVAKSVAKKDRGTTQSGSPSNSVVQTESPF